MSEAPGHGRDERFVLAVDLGSTALKIGLASCEGRVVWWDHRPVTTLHGDRGAVTQDPDEWWRVLAEGARRGLAESGVDGDRVTAVCVTAQFGSTVPVDAEGHAVGPCLMWSDTRGESHSRAIFGGRLQGYSARMLATWMHRSGGIPTPSGADPVGHMLYLSRDRPDIAQATRWYLEPVDYLTMRFTGVPSATHASMLLAWLTDNRRMDRLTYDERLVDLSQVDESRLPPLLPLGSVVGKVQTSVATELGISPAARVVTGLPDSHSAALGAGCVHDYEAHMAVGTTAWISCGLPRKKSDVLRQMATIPGLTSDRYLLVNAQPNTGRSLEWFRDHVAECFAPGGSWTFEELSGLAATASPGAGGVIFTPWLAGERSPVEDHAARGGFHNLSLSTTGADLARALLEGVAYNARWLLEAAEHFAGRRLEPIRLVGGVARSELWCQIFADVLDRRLERLEDPLLAGLRGCALSAGIALGEVSRDEIRDLVPVDRTFEPDPGCRAVYDRQSKELPRLYKAQKGMFHRLNRG
jgi:xylulokinase